MLDLLIALTLALLSPHPIPSFPGSPFAGLEARTGRIVYYGPGWKDWTCPADQKCGIAARQGVTPAPGEWCVATWNQEELGRRGVLLIGRRAIPVRVCDYASPTDLPMIRARGIVAEIPYPLAETVPGMLASGSAPGTLALARRPASAPTAESKSRCRSSANANAVRSSLPGAALFASPAHAGVKAKRFDVLR